MHTNRELPPLNSDANADVTAGSFGVFAAAAAAAAAAVASNCWSAARCCLLIMQMSWQLLKIR